MHANNSFPRISFIQDVTVFFSQEPVGAKYLLNHHLNLNTKPAIFHKHSKILCSFIV